MTTKTKRLFDEAALDAATRDILISDPALFIAHYSGLKLKDFHIDILDFIAHNEKTVTLIPATHGKSTLISKWYVIWRICHNPNIRIILVMKNDEEAQLYASNIRQELTSNIPLIRDWGPFKPQGREVMWNNSALFVAKRQINDVRPTIEFVGSNSISQVLGHRCDILLCDDIVTLDTVNTIEQSDKQIERFNLGAQTCPRYLWDLKKDGTPDVPDGIHFPLDVAYKQVILIGTVFKPYDLFHKKAGKIKNLKPGKVYSGKDHTYKVLYFDCWRDFDTLEPLWPEQWTAEALLEQMETMGKIDFDRRYRNISSDEGMLAFKKWWIYGQDHNGISYPGCLDTTRQLGDLDLKRPWMALGFDPSTSRKSKDSSFAALVLLAIDLEDSSEIQMRHVVDVWRGQIGFEDLFARVYFGDEERSIEGMWNLHNYNELRVERNSAQKWFLEADKTKAAESRGIVVNSHETGAEKHDPIMGVASMQNLFRDGLIRIPYHPNPTTREPIEDFLEQIEEFPEGFQDYAMALWFAELAIRERQSQYRAWSGNSKGIFIKNPHYNNSRS